MLSCAIKESTLLRQFNLMQVKSTSVLTDLEATSQPHIESECTILSCNSTQSLPIVTSTGLQFIRLNSSCFEGE